MSAPREPFQQLKQPRSLASVTPEQRYWRKFRPQTVAPSPSKYPITHIAYAPSPRSPSSSSVPTSQHFAVTTGPRIQIYSIRDGALIKTISRFENIAHSGELRRDGRLVVGADETGAIQVFDVNSRTIIKTWREHKQPVWVTKFAPEGNITRLMSGCDDRSVRLWDLTEGKSIQTLTGHGDYVRCGGFLPGQDGNLVASGSYDQTVRIWDSRVGNTTAVMTFKHAAPVEEVLPMPSGTTLLAAAGNQISVLDLVAARPAQSLQHHQKTVSSLCLASKGTRVVSGGLDGHLKIFDISTWNVVYASKYPSPILSCNVIPSSRGENRHLAVGLESGDLRLRTLLSPTSQTSQKHNPPPPEISYAYEALTNPNAPPPSSITTTKKRKLTQGHRARTRGLDFQAASEDPNVITIQGSTLPSSLPRKEKPYQLSLRRGHHSTSLSQALASPTPLPPADIHALLLALRHRSALRAALADRDDLAVVPVFEWVTRYLAVPKYSKVCAEAAEVLIDEYAVHLGGGGSRELERVWGRLKRRVEREVEVGMESVRCLGMLEMVVEGGGGGGGAGGGG